MCEDGEDPRARPASSQARGTAGGHGSAGWGGGHGSGSRVTGSGWRCLRQSSGTAKAEAGERVLSRGTSWESGDSYAPCPQNKIHVHNPRLLSICPGQAPGLGPAGAVVSSASLVSGLGEVDLKLVRKSLPWQLVTDRRTDNGAAPSKPGGAKGRGV